MKLLVLGCLEVMSGKLKYCSRLQEPSGVRAVRDVMETVGASDGGGDTLLAVRFHDPTGPGEAVPSVLVS
jgi:hypothetical protein